MEAKEKQPHTQELEPVGVGSCKKERFPIDSEVLADGMDEAAGPEASSTGRSGEHHGRGE